MKEVVRDVVVYLFWLSIFIAATWLCGGCSVNESSESLTIGEEVVYKSEVKQTLWLYFTKTKGVQRRTPLSSLRVGSIESEPDPNSIDAVSQGILELALEGWLK